MKKPDLRPMYLVFAIASFGSAQAAEDFAIIPPDVQSDTRQGALPAGVLVRVGAETTLSSIADQVTRKDVTIDTGKIKIVGRLYFPPRAKRPCPAAVVVHGSAPSTRFDMWRYYTSICLRMGVAVLAYDKRGCGESGGSFRRFNVPESTSIFDELADDAAAAFDWLRRQEGIDPSRVGFVGGSQAGWIMPLAASRTEGTRFIICGTGPTISAGEEDYHGKLTGDGRRKGMSIEEADRLLDRYSGPRGYDPRALLKAAATPTLWIFGSQDNVMPTNASVAELQRIIADGNTRHRYHVIEGCNHNYRNPASGERFLLQPVMSAWLGAQNILRNSAYDESTIGTMRAHVSRVEMTVPSGDATLRGRLLIPPGAPRPCPAVVLPYGASRPRWYENYYTPIFLRLGLAVAAYDRRGCGESTGVYRRLSAETGVDVIEEQARDALAVMKWLKGRDEIDPHQIGLAGGGSSIYTIARAASLAEGVRFIVSGCGYLLSVGEQREWTKLSRRVRQKTISLTEAERMIGAYAGPTGYDPLPFLERATTPTLWIFGSRDNTIPTYISIAEIARLDARVADTHTIHIIDGSDHDYRSSDGDGYLLEPIIGSWLRTQGVQVGRSKGS